MRPAVRLNVFVPRSPLVYAAPGACTGLSGSSAKLNECCTMAGPSGGRSNGQNPTQDQLARFFELSVTLVADDVLVMPIGLRVRPNAISVEPRAHRFRHTLATALLEKGWTTEDVAIALGSTPDIMRRHYAQWTTERQERIWSLAQDVWSGEFWQAQKIRFNC